MKKITAMIVAAAAVLMIGVSAQLLKPDGSSAAPETITVETVIIAPFNAKSLKNDSPPVFGAPVMVPKRHRGFQLALGEECIFARPGTLVHLHVRCNLEKGWYTYPAFQQGKIGPSKTEISLNGKAAFIEGEITTTPPPSVDENATEAYGHEIRRFSESFYFDIPVRVSASAPAGQTEMKLEIVSGAVCDFY